MTYPHNRTPTEKEDLFFGKKVAKVLRGETVIKKPNSKAETDLQTKICRWIVKEYPGTVFLSDFAAGLKLSPYLASVRSNQSCEYKVPDLYIFGPLKPLIIEIKVSNDNLFLKDGVTLGSEHVQLQYETIKKLRLNCYADFGVGEDDIKMMIRMYMAGNVFVYKTIRDNPTYLSKINNRNSAHTSFIF